MVLTPQQHIQIAEVYDKCAADQMVPRPHREAFARKAEWFRMLARLGAKPKSKQPAKTSNNSSPSPGTLGSTGMVSAARQLFAWQQRR